MVMRDPETEFERQLLSPSFGGHGVEFRRNVVPGDLPPPHRRGLPSTWSWRGGRLWALLGSDEYFLEEGDALYFEADVPYRFENAGEGERRYYLVNRLEGQLRRGVMGRQQM
jgi:hypothetical protein